MSQNPSEEVRFLANVSDLIDLIHELTSMCWDSGCQDLNPTLILAAGAYLKSYDKIKLIETFITYSNEHWEKIRTRDENFFINNAHEIFQHLPVQEGKINAFKILFTATEKDGTPIVVKEDRDAVWEIFDSLVKICIKYIHRVREVKYVKTDKGMRPYYVNKEKFPKIKVRKEAKSWNITLPMPSLID